MKLLFYLLFTLSIVLCHAPTSLAQEWGGNWDGNWEGNNLFFDISPAFEIPMGTDIQTVFPIGGAIRGGIDINTYKKSLYLKPNGGISYFSHYYGVSAQEVLLKWHVGLDVRYYLRPVNDTTIWNFYPTIGISYNGLNNRIEPQAGVLGDVINMTSGSGLSYMGGIGVLYRLFYVEVGYIYLSPIMKANEQAVAMANANSGLYEPFEFNEVQMDMSHIRFEVGVKIRIR